MSLAIGNGNVGVSRGVLAAVVVAVVVVALAGGLVGYYVTHPPTKTVTVVSSTATTVTTTTAVTSTVTSSTATTVTTSTATTVTTTAVTTTATTVTTSTATTVTTTATPSIPMAQTIELIQVSPTLVPQYFETGQIDVFLNPYFLSATIWSQLRSIPGIVMLSPTYASGDALEFNPYPSNTTFNPLAYWQFRFLLNYLIPRSYYVSQIFSGMAAPALAWPFIWGINSYLLIFPEIVKYNIHYDPTYFNQSVFTLFQDINKTDPVWHGRILYISGKWYYIPPNSTTPKPVTIIFFIRNDDPFRYSIGQDMMAKLVSMGFTVQPIYGSLSTAYATVYGSNPADMQWSIYTAGWIIGPSPWDTSAGAGWCASWASATPGWGTSGYWIWSNATIDNLTWQISVGNFTSLAQFENLSRIALFDCFQQSLIDWIAAIKYPYPASSSVVNYMPSLTGLEWSLGLDYAYSTAHPDILKIGMLHVSQTSGYNAFQWLYSTDIYTDDMLNFIFDPFYVSNPFTGEPQAARGGWSVEISPNGSAIFPVPANAVIWNATLGKWVTVGPGHYSKDVIRYYFNGTWLGQKWQDGQPISMADILFGYYVLFDLAQSGKDLGPNVAAASDLAGTLSTIPQTVVGMQFFPNGTVVVYDDYWFPDPNIVAPAFLPILMPWPILALQFYAYQQGKYAFTTNEAQSLKIPQMDFRSPDFNKYIAGVLQDWISTGYVWDNGSWAIVNGYNYLNSSMVTEAYKDALNFYNTYGNLLVGSGPYILKSIVTVSPQSAILVRWSGYPFNYTWWFNRIYVSQGVTQLPPGGNLVPAVISVSSTNVTIGQPASFNVTMYTPAGKPLIYVFLVSPNGTVVFSGNFTGTVSGFTGTVTFTIPASITSKL
ncbi:MAG: ABC transporter substrate-binding protein, partial [Caldivirga sp.]|uniref:ABC transporter substrate-binding protein n=1 Tax=Caldivirga sp. TaxID=2080243 RepID=UPI003D10FB04